MPWATGLPDRPAGKPSALPDVARPYPQLLRGARRRWWKPVVALVLAAVAIALLGLVVIVATGAIGGLVVGAPDLIAYIDRVFDATELDVVGFVGLNLSLAVCIPVAGLSIWAVHRVRPGYVTSVVGRMRWRWLLRCVVVLLPLWVVYVGLGVALDPPPQGRPPHWIALMFVVLVLTPLQAAGEEYFFRGFLMQNLGAWFARPLLALIVPGALSAACFAAAHGSPDLWVLADLATFAVVATLMGWRTGGLEAGIAMHALNNMLLFWVVIGYGGWQDAFVGGDTTSTPGSYAVSVVFQAAGLALVWWQARRPGVQRLFLPGGPARPTPSSGFVTAYVPVG